MLRAPVAAEAALVLVAAGAADDIEAMEELVAVPAMSEKLAHVRRVKLAEWMTSDRLPKKEFTSSIVAR